ncbi:hypothetical protein, partial [Campylobacter sp. MG1]|uniref:hypothetical protein n=1 Tax=Campylobacter sp. MG1 TaxID=2976332 RepID=UPI00226CAFB7
MCVEFLKENKTGTIDIDFSDEELNNISMGLYEENIRAMYNKIGCYIALKNKISTWDFLGTELSTEALCNVLKKFSEKGLIEFFDAPDKIKEELFYGSKNYSKEESLNMIKSWKVDVDKVICDIKEKE